MHFHKINPDVHIVDHLLKKMLDVVHDVIGTYEVILVIDFRDIMQQGECNIQSSFKLFNEEDFPTAAFLVQQGLEKYLKAYLLKTNLIKDSKQLGHLQYAEILKEALKILTVQKNKEDEKEMIHVLEVTINHFTILQKIFSNVENNRDQQILFWKKSLNLPLTKHEENILKGIHTKMQTSSTKYLTTLTSYLTSKSFVNGFVKGKLPKHIKAKLPKILLEYIQALRSGSSSQVQFVMEKLLNLIRPYLYGSGPQSISKEASDFMLKLNVIDTTFQWSEYVLLSFPHSQIGRYPTIIGDEDSVILYKERKDELFKLMLSIRLICTKIKSAMIKSSDI